MAKDQGMVLNPSKLAGQAGSRATPDPAELDADGDAGNSSDLELSALKLEDPPVLTISDEVG
jgi:hypothetical protein